ncbi:hypothetical protein GOP47_0001850 [Adiantum capillus-veneris]|uniref:Uncharacterized protein n=1 Tax=Adiantum capillus-veneris TaxID=13818 RepID=A0A9D4VAW0_ADICA|nr:hypothetical protein GOP47_0001850 [Adiantum capillus-veneris]
MKEVGQPLLHDARSSQLQPDSSAHTTSSTFWRKALLPLGAYCCCQVAFHGIFTSLVLYLKRVRNEDNATAAATASAVLGSGFCTSFFAAFLSDGFLGRLWTSVLILTIFFLGCGFLSIITQLQLNAPVFFNISLYLAGLGYGWFKPGLAALGGDQFDLPKDRNTFYNRLFVAGTIGEIFSLTVVTYIENRGQWALGYWICTGAIGVGVMCLVGMKGIKYSVRENPFKRIAHVLICAVRKRKVDVPAYADALFESSKESGCLMHTDRFRFLDKAATISKGDIDGLHAGSPWRLCSVQKVEEVKSLINILPIWAVLLCKAVATSQLTSLFVEQGDAMDVMVGSFDVAPASMSLFNMLARIVIAIVFDLHTRRTPTSSRRTSSTAFLQIGIAFGAAILTMLIAALVETIRLVKVHSGTQLSILWLVPQYAFEGITLVCAVIGEADFFYSAAGPAVRSLSSSLPVLSRGLASYISALLVTVVTFITTANGQSGWIAADLDNGQLNYFYLLLASITILAFLLFLMLGVEGTFKMELLQEDDRRESSEVGKNSPPTTLCDSRGINHGYNALFVPRIHPLEFLPLVMSHCQQPPSIGSANYLKQYDVAMPEYHSPFQKKALLKMVSGHAFGEVMFNPHLNPRKVAK